MENDLPKSQKTQNAEGLTWNFVYENIFQEYQASPDPLPLTRIEAKDVFDVMNMYEALYYFQDNNETGPIPIDLVSGFIGFNGSTEENLQSFTNYVLSKSGEYGPIQSTVPHIGGIEHIQGMHLYRKMVEVWKGLGEKSHLSEEEARAVFAVGPKVFYRLP